MGSNRNRWTVEEDRYLRQAHAEKLKRDDVVQGLRNQFNSVRTIAAITKRMSIIIQLDAPNNPPAAAANANVPSKAVPVRTPVAYVAPSVTKVTSVPNLRKIFYMGSRGVVFPYAVESMPQYGGTFLKVEEIFSPENDKRGVKSRATHMIPVNAIAKRDLRAMHSRDEMKHVLEYIESNPPIPALKGPSHVRRKYVEGQMKSLSIADQVEVALCLLSPRSPSCGSFMEHGTQVLKMLSGEYALAVGGGYEAAETRFKQALGIKIAPGPS